MDHLFSAFMLRRTRSNSKQNSSCGDIPDLYVSKKRMLKRASFDSRYSPSSPSSDRAKSMSSSELINVVDAQLMQIREKLAAFRQQDTQFRERMNSLNGSVSELASQSSVSSFTPSECSDLGSLDEVSETEEEEFKQQRTAKQRALLTDDRDHFNRPPIKCFHHIRQLQSSDPNLMHSHMKLSEEKAVPYSADQVINLYPQYNNPEEISTLF